jgi:replicative DNA helicase
MKDAIEAPVRPEKVNPISLPAERSVLGALIEDDSLLDEVIEIGLRPEHFALSDHRRVFEVMCTLNAQHRPIDYVTVAEQLGNRREHYVLVSSLIQGVIIHADHVTHHARIIMRKARLRSLLRLAEWIFRVVDDTANPDALVEEAIGKLNIMAAAEVVA